LSNYSLLSKFGRVLAIVFRFISNCEVNKIIWKYDNISVDEIYIVNKLLIIDLKNLTYEN